MLNAFTIDLEPWMCYYPDMPLDKKLDAGNLVKTTRRLLGILEDCNATATFFTLGIVYEWYPDLIDEIQARGHEIAFHGYSHRALEGDVLEKEIRKSKTLLDKFGVTGFRAPRMQITKQCIKILQSAKFKYDSSLYGSYGASENIRDIIEVPVSTYPFRNSKSTLPRALEDTLRNFEMPVGSGLFMGILNTKFVNALIRKTNRKGWPFILFVHPWQLSCLPVTRLLSGITRLRFLYSVKLSEDKLTSLLKNNAFASIREGLKEWNVN